MERYRKSRTGAPPGFFGTEAAGLRWLTVPGGPRVASVLDVGPDHLDLERVDAGAPTPAAARAFGRALAVLHGAGAPAIGALPPGADAGWFGPLDDPLPMAAGAWADWPTFYAEARLRPVVEQGRRRGILDAADSAAVEAVCARLGDLAGPPEPPARLHGDLWSGNVLWSPAGDGRGSEAVLIDPAAHGGHRETDLAMLALFGAPHLDHLLAAYDETRPLAPGWRERTGLHQLYPLAVHAVLFGGGYVARTRRLLARLGP
ncbi:fructosamine-3-kinase [Isoptericola jiangsuensis]|uniref:Fructosamine-3-kinase n=1 Tax=Isoptericola jiangsuensis TaxID=548579 RepID=A0A2A9EW03_9MICO|nr:fructosamine kinase family protein [Isoptericola jiangsuensis]PFG43068.1 fructosamine-3-kinase [Isoptericola jiangsuensis]